MRGLILILAMLVLIPVALGAEAELLNPIGTCSQNGTVIASLLHRGGVLPVDNIETTATFARTNTTKKISGYWEKDSMNISVIIDDGGSSRVFFYSNPDAFTKMGQYVLKFKYFAISTDYYPTEVSLKLFCPGKGCVGDSECSGDEYCNESKCIALSCDEDEYAEFNRCIPLCNDNNACTEDLLVNGRCVYTQINDCCSKDIDCDDGLACTVGKCINQTCSFSPKQCAPSTDKCVTAACIEPSGCVYTSNEQCIGEEKEKREYFITIGEPTVTKKSFFTKIGEWLDRFFGNLF